MDTPIHGTCDPRFEPVEETFRMHFARGKDVGASFALMIGDELLVDLYGGYADKERTRPWERNTIVNVFSTTKIMTALCIHILRDRGMVSYDAPVMEYWPEFGCNGKEEVKVWHLLTHSSGLPHFGEPIEPEALYDWDRMIGILERQAPLWEPGTKLGYHMTTFGYLVGEIVRRVTGKMVSTFFKEEVADPMDIDFMLGVPPDQHDRIADLIPPKNSMLQRIARNNFLYKLLRKPIFLQVIRNPSVASETGIPNTPEWRSAEIPASNGHGNAVSIARVGAILANGGMLEGKRVLSSDTVNESVVPRVKGKDIVTFEKHQFGLGWAVNQDKLPHGKVAERAFQWGGLGGSICWMDLDERMSFAFAMNKMNLRLLGKQRRERFRDVVYKCLRDA
ncbi:serine hydrolase [Candidatus Bathyarchaeota archaeon]|nr:serine hydrolase [Candidatus Bathyarchaeota archaeon]